MHTETARRLLELNRKFYLDFGEAFSATRARIQPGVQKLAAGLAGTERILDLGCGNAELARHLERRGHMGAYTGLDFSPPLLAQAGGALAGMDVRFLQADLAGDDWDAPLRGAQFERIFAFASLHHLPGEDLRLRVLAKARRLLAQGGLLALSNWQFLNSARLRGRICDWDRAGLSENDVDAGDHLLDWRRGGAGLRYVHHFNETELAQLAQAAGFRVLDTFYSDGEGGRLGLYQVWEGV